MTLPWVGAFALAAAVFSSALAVVYVKHMTRMTFVELQGLEHERDALQVEWSKLQLELGTWASHDRVELDNNRMRSKNYLIGCTHDSDS